MNTGMDEGIERKREKRGARWKERERETESSGQIVVER